MSGAPKPSLGERAERAGRLLETVLLALALGAMIVLASAQISLRNFGGGGLAWADEALRLLVLWVTMLGAIAAGRDQRHVSIDALSRYLPRAWLCWVARASDFFAAAVCLVLAWYSGLFVADSLAADDRILGGGLPAWVAQLVLPVAFGLLGYRYVVAGLRHEHRPGAPGAGH